MTSLLNGQSPVVANGTASATTDQNRAGFRTPDVRLRDPEFPEVEMGIYVADPRSRNAGSVYFDVRRVGEKGERFKTLRLGKDFFGSLKAHGVLADELSVDSTLSDSERQEYREAAICLANLFEARTSPKNTVSQAREQRVSPTLARYAG